MKNILIVMANAKPGRDDEFNEWYNSLHLAESLAVDENFVTGQRMRLVEAQMTKDAPEAPFRYVAIYEVENLDAADAALYALARVERADAIAAGRRPIHVNSDAMAPQVRTWWYKPISGVIGTPTDTSKPIKNALTVFSNALEGRNEEFNEWYTGMHIQEILDIDDAFVNGQRFELVEASMTMDSDEAPFKYLAFYQVDDITQADATLYRLARAERVIALAEGRTPPIVMSPSMSPDMRTWWWTSASPLVDRSAVPAVLEQRAKAAAQ